MTRNQIEFLKYQESKRSNQANEAETKRANQVRESQMYISLDEQSRHNLATEKLGADTLLEQTRHNLEAEAEIKRSNTAREMETSRHNLAQEAETQRSNLAHEHISLNTLNETIRANRATESQRDRELKERERANRAAEMLNSQRLSETVRANRAAEKLRERQFSHSVTTDTRRLDIEQYRAEEQHRSNVVYEGIAIADKITRAGQLAENIRSNIARETETARHNLATELKDYRPIITLNNSSSSQGSTSSSTNSITGRDGRDSLPGNSPTTPRLPGGGGSSGNQSTPKLVSYSVVSRPYQGVTSEISGAILGNEVQITRERYSDGSSKYYEEVIRHGQIVSRKQISEAEARRQSTR